MRTATYNNTNWASSYANLSKLQKCWGLVEKVLIQTGAHVKPQAMIYKAVIQTVLLYGCESWVVIEKIWQC